MKNVVYSNVHVNNAVTTLHHDTFVTGRLTNMATKENPFLRDRRVMGAPDIRPEQSTLMPVIKNIAQANRPPQQIVNRVSDERGRNNRLDQIQTQRNLPAGPTGSTTRTGQTNDRKIKVPQSSLSVPARVEQAPPVRNPNVITGPQESREERMTRRLDELKRNTPPQNNLKGTTLNRPLLSVHNRTGKKLAVSEERSKFKENLLKSLPMSNQQGPIQYSSNLQSPRTM